MTDVSGQALRWLSALVIVSLLTGCDNVRWGGADLRLEPPPPATVGAPAAAPDEPPPDPLDALGDDRVLFRATRDGGEATVVPVAAISGDSLRALPDEATSPGFHGAFARARLAPGTRLLLFRDGVRAGTLTLADTLTDASICGAPRPAARGPVELRPGLAGAERFVALVEGDGTTSAYRPLPEVTEDAGHRNASVSLAAEVIPRVGARWPTSLPGARRALDVTRLDPDGAEAFAATFLFRDRLAVAEAEPASWALFVLGVEAADGWEPAYLWFREVGRHGRGVPHLVTHHDWDGDGESELLLELLGEAVRWMAAVGRDGDGTWARTWEDACAPPAPDAADDGTGRG